MVLSFYINPNPFPFISLVSFQLSLQSLSMETHTLILDSQMSLLQNPISSVSIVYEPVVNLRGLLTCSAIILAFLFTFSRLFTKCTQILTSSRSQKGNIVIPTPLHDYSDEESDEESESESDDESEYSLLSFEEEEEIEFNHSFRVAGSDKLKMSLSWSDFVTGRNVVKSWDGLGLGFEKASESLISLWDSEFNHFNSGTKYQIPALSMPSPSVIVSAGLTTGKNVALRVFDTRLRRQIPQIFAEWQPCRKRAVGEDSGETNGDVDGGSVVVRDLRKLGASPLEELAESDVVRTWWDNRDVVVDGNREITCLGNGNGSVVLRCRNAVFSSLL